MSNPSDNKVRDSAGATTLASIPSIPSLDPITRELHPEIREVQGDEPLLDIVASDETVDRYREIISASGWVLDNYRNNPVILNNHQYDNIAHTLGRADVTEIRNGALCQRIRWAVDANPVAAVAFRLYKGGFLRAFSVGFHPLEWQDMDDPADTCRRKYTKQELLEVSAVSIPANPNALALALKCGTVPQREFDALYDYIHTLRTSHGDDPVSSGSAAAAADDGYAAALLCALQRAHKILRGA
jgi:HK97 family phage prohead protease